MCWNIMFLIWMLELMIKRVLCLNKRCTQTSRCACRTHPTNKFWPRFAFSPLLSMFKIIMSNLWLLSCCFQIFTMHAHEPAPVLQAKYAVWLSKSYKKARWQGGVHQLSFIQKKSHTALYSIYCFSRPALSCNIVIYCSFAYSWLLQKHGETSLKTKLPNQLLWFVKSLKSALRWKTFSDCLMT